MAHHTTLRVDRDDRGVATVTLDRPEVRNAFDATMIAELTEVAADLGGDDAVRVVVLAAAGDRVFSAGADLNWMGSMRDWSYEENVADARRMDAMFRALWDLPKPLVGRINGHALGGGTGLTAVCDIAIAAEEATFGFTEVLLGIAPAVISPYAVRKVGTSFARAVFVTGERFDARRALAAGLVHEVVPADGLDAAVEAAVARCLRAAPQAAGAAKSLPDLALRPLEEATARTVEVIAGLRVAEEGQAGMAAFLAKEQPPWVVTP
jgi:methylglutaconyl-CoA hydratase